MCACVRIYTYNSCDGSFNSAVTVVVCGVKVLAVAVARHTVNVLSDRILNIYIYAVSNSVNVVTNRTKIFVSNTSLKTGYIYI